MPIFKRTAQDPIPPEELQFVGGGDFKAVGTEFLGHFQEFAGLSPTDDVLDIGCGVGRLAVPLARYLKSSARYVGFDVEPRAIKWCDENVTPLHAGFTFTHADLYNKRYSPGGTVKASEFCFPCSDVSIDFAFATSIFTHLLAEDMEHYLAEAARVLRPNATLFMTYYLLNDGVLERRPRWKPGLTLEHELDGCLVNSLHVPEGVIAYPQQKVEEVCRSVGLEIDQVIPGAWSGVTGPTNQDIVIARR